jgi:hypothetical protein
MFCSRKLHLNGVSILVQKLRICIAQGIFHALCPGSALIDQDRQMTATAMAAFRFAFEGMQAALYHIDDPADHPPVINQGIKPSKSVLNRIHSLIDRSADWQVLSLAYRTRLAA